jgi:hypothetical protein
MIYYNTGGKAKASRAYPVHFFTSIDIARPGCAGDPWAGLYGAKYSTLQSGLCGKGLCVVKYSIKIFSLSFKELYIGKYFSKPLCYVK